MNYLAVAYSQLRSGDPMIDAFALLPLLRDMDRRLTKLEENPDRTQTDANGPEPRG